MGARNYVVVMSDCHQFHWLNICRSVGETVVKSSVLGYVPIFGRIFQNWVLSSGVTSIVFGMFVNLETMVRDNGLTPLRYTKWSLGFLEKT